MAERKSDFALPTLDDLFSTQEERDEARLEKIRDIPLDLIDDFPDHPFHVRDDEDMVQLVESIKTNGVLTPAVLRQKEDGRYEIVSGHRRKRACELAGLTTLRSEIKDLTRDEAIVYMVESNFQRTTILPSEKAFAYKMRLEAIKRQGQRTDLTSATLLQKSGKTSREIIAENSGESHDGKGIMLSRGFEDNAPRLLLNWSKVEKRIGELIKLDRYLNPKEREYYPTWLENRSR